MKKALILLCSLALVLLVGCGICRTDADCAPANPRVGVQYSCSQGKCIETPLGNPATEFCLQNGGLVELRQSAEGEYGVCIFADGSECDEWAFFRQECYPGQSLRPVAEEVPPQVTGMSCAPFNVPGKLCTSEFAPVCAKIEMTSGTRWITFQNACLACKAAQRPATTITYVPGPCETQ